MKAGFRHPLVLLATWAAWLLLTQSVAPVQVILGAVLGFVMARFWRRLEPPPARIRHPLLILRLVLRVAGDMFLANLAVARIVLLNRPYRSGLIEIPLQLAAPWGIAALSCIITATPGTIWVRHDAAQRLLVIHVLDLKDPPAAIAAIQRRYAAPLQEIFG